MIEDSEQLVNSGRAHEYVHKEEVVVFWNDYHRVSGPNESCCCQGSTEEDWKKHGFDIKRYTY